jgi:hypothetical protein
VEREPGRPFECVVLETGELQPTQPARARALGARRGEVVTVREMTVAELRSERQQRYWFVAIVGTVRDIWQRERGYLIPKEAVHNALVTIFGGGLVETPLGQARTSSATKSKRKFNEMVEGVRDYVWHTYGVPIPSGEEWMREHCAGEDL